VKRENSTEKSTKLKREHSNDKDRKSGHKCLPFLLLALHFSLLIVPFLARPRPSKAAIVRPQTRHTLHLPKAEKKASDRNSADGEDIVIPLSRSPLRSGSSTPKASDGARTPERPGTPPGELHEQDEDLAARAVNELIHSFQTTFKITSRAPAVATPAPRKERFPVNKDTTTEQSPEVVLAKLKEVLLDKDIAFGFSSPFCLLCHRDDIAFELEICSIPNLEVNGIRFHRISGDVWDYSKLCKSILTDMNLSEE